MINSILEVEDVWFAPGVFLTPKRRNKKSPDFEWRRCRKCNPTGSPDRASAGCATCAGLHAVIAEVEAKYPRSDFRDAILRYRPSITKVGIAAGLSAGQLQSLDSCHYYHHWWSLLMQRSLAYLSKLKASDDPRLQRRLLKKIEADGVLGVKTVGTPGPRHGAPAQQVMANTSGDPSRRGR